MKSHLGTALLLAAGMFVLTGCGGPPVSSIGTGTGGASAPVSIVMTDTPPAGFSLLSLQLTLTGATLTPGNVSVLSAPVTVEMTRLQTEQALLSTQKVAAGKYTGMTLTFSNPTMTFENDGTSTVTVGATNCAVSMICTTLSPTLTNSSVTVTLPLTVSANVPAAVLVSLNLANFLTNSSGTIAANAQATGAVTVTQLTSTGGAPFASIEDVVGVVSSVNSTAGTFQLSNALGSFTVATSTGSSGTSFLNFPASGSCSAASPSFACVANGQIVSVNMGLQSAGTLIATRIFFEDSSNAQPEVEGVVVATNGTQFSFVVLQETPSVSGVPIGSEEVVSTQNATFDVDNLGASAGTSLYLFTGSQSLMVGQEVQVLAASTGATIDASRVRLRSSRITATVTNTNFPQFTVGNSTSGTLPAFLQAAGVTKIVVTTLTSPAPNFYTELVGASNIDQISISPPNNVVAVRGQLFSTGSSPAWIATKVILE